MNIGYDGKRALQNFTGLGNYSRLVIESMAQTFVGDSLTVFSPPHSDNPRLNQINSLPNVHIRFPQPGEARMGNSLWRTFGITPLLPRMGIDVYHGLSNELPLNIAGAGVPSVLTMHDVIYRTLPYCYTAIDRKIYDWKYGRSCRNATRIIAISECTKRDVMRFYEVPEERIDVIYQGVDPIFKKEIDRERLEDVKRIYELPQRYILQVGSIERRKNALLTVRALSALPADVQLILVGRSTAYLDQVLTEAERLGVNTRVRVLHRVPFVHLPLLYKLAQAAVYPSYYEGFGLPVLEALTVGVPCVATTGSCLEEAGGGAALYVDPDDPRELAGALHAILGGQRPRAELIEQGKIHADRFHNEGIAQKIHDVYIHAIKDYARAKSAFHKNFRV